jgi:2-polyprenyl-3-methyl-5-hydroxy-6-metoxy-1,4-benzoquinol methylase
MSVLDIGSGLGPARQIAHSSGCSVGGVDITPAYVDAAQALTRAAGLHNHVSFVCGDIAALDLDDFEAAYTMHVQVNVADKKTFFSEITLRLRPGAALRNLRGLPHRRHPTNPASTVVARRHRQLPRHS